MIATPPAAFIEFSEVLQPLLGQRVPPRDDLAAARYIFVLKCHLASPQEKTDANATNQPNAVWIVLVKPDIVQRSQPPGNRTANERPND